MSECLSDSSSLLTCLSHTLDKRENICRDFSVPRLRLGLSLTPPLGQRVLAVVGARHPRPPARHREAERQDPPPRPAARVRAWASGRGRGGAVAAGAPRHPAGGARRGGPVSGARRPRAGR